MTPLSDNNACDMWDLMEDLFPVYRSLCGPGFTRSLERVGEEVPLEITKVPSGTRLFDWTVPKEFSVKEAHIVGPDGKRYLDFDDCHYHVWAYSQPFSGEMERGELLEHVSTRPDLPAAVPFRNSYYRPRWGLCASENQVRALPEGRYRIHIDTEHTDGFLRIGECHLPGETDDEVMITSYLCHPRGANDNLSGVVVATELFKLLARLPRRRYSYRLAIWPETIGSITYIATYPERLSKVVGGYCVTCVGDGGDATYKTSHHGSSLIDRAALHALRHSGRNHTVLPYQHAIGSDECQFNAVGLRLPFGSIMRTMYARFPEYHSSADDLNFVQPQHLLESLRLYWAAIMAIEHAVTYKGNYTVDPFLTGHGIYPYQHGFGTGATGDAIGGAYYHLMGGADGETDLLEIADRAGEPIAVFDAAVSDFLRAGLISETAMANDKSQHRVLKELAC